MGLERNSGVSLKFQIVESLKSEIDSLDHSEKIPNEEEHVKKFGVSRGTIRSAISELVQQGLLYRLQGKGTFKAGTTIYNSGRTLTSLTEQLTSRGLKPGIKDKSITTEFADEEVSEILQIGIGKPVWKVSRLRLVDNLMISYNTAFIRKEIIPQITKSDFKMSLVDMITNRFMIRLVKAENYCNASCADKYLADKLSVDVGTAILNLKHIAYGVEDEKPFYVDYVYAIGDRQFLRFEQSSFLVHDNP